MSMQFGAAIIFALVFYVLLLLGLNAIRKSLDYED